MWYTIQRIGWKRIRHVSFEGVNLGNSQKGESIWEKVNWVRNKKRARIFRLIEH